MQYENEIDIPKNTVMICQQIMNDKRLGKTTKTRLSVAYIYGLIRRTFNLSLNNIKDHFNKTYNIIYCINKVKKLQKRSGLGKNTVTYSLKVLTKYGYLDRYRNKIKHIIYINLPLVIKHHLVHPEILNQINFSEPSGFKNQTRRVYKSNPPSLKSKPRCSDSYSSDSEISDSCNVTDKQNNQNQKLIYSWGKNTRKNFGFSKQIIQTVESYLLHNHKSYEDASIIAKTINYAKNNTNIKFKGVFYSNYYHNETNSYLRSERFINLLRDSLNNDNDLYDAIVKDYREYLINNTNLKLRSSSYSNKSYNGRKPEIEQIPQYMKDEQSGKVKPKKASRLLNKLNEAQNEHLQVIDDPKVSQDEKELLEKRVQHYQKLYNAKQQSTKPTPNPNPKHHKAKQPKGLKKISKALHDQIQARLKRLGEE